MGEPVFRFPTLQVGSPINDLAHQQVLLHRLNNVFTHPSLTNLLRTNEVDYAVMQVLEQGTGLPEVIDALQDVNVLDEDLKATCGGTETLQEWLIARKQAMSRHELLLYKLFLKS
jgi:hypothetical protein